MKERAMVYHLMARAPRPPFTDWLAQVERIASRRAGDVVRFDGDNPAMRGCYDVGLSAAEVARDWHDWSKGNA
jgi:hypothetical protein